MTTQERDNARARLLWTIRLKALADEGITTFVIPRPSRALHWVLGELHKRRQHREPDTARDNTR